MVLHITTKGKNIVQVQHYNVDTNPQVPRIDILSSRISFLTPTAFASVFDIPFLDETSVPRNILPFSINFHSYSLTRHACTCMHPVLNHSLRTRGTRMDKTPPPIRNLFFFELFLVLQIQKTPTIETNLKSTIKDIIFFTFLASAKIVKFSLIVFDHTGPSISPGLVCRT